MNDQRDPERDGVPDPEPVTEGDSPVRPVSEDETIELMHESGEAAGLEPETVEVQREIPQGYALAEAEGESELVAAPPVDPTGFDAPEEEVRSEVPEVPARSYAVDALRGLAILGMCLSGLLAGVGGLWNGMYHGSFPQWLPAAMTAEADSAATDAEALETALDALASEGWRLVDEVVFRGDWPAFTWVDWVFPLFLFAMGVAIPLAYTNRRARGASWWAYPFRSVWRFVALVGFAVYVHQVVPTVIDSPPTLATWCMGLIGFLIPFAVFVRLPGKTGWAARLGLRLLGLGAAVSLVAWINVREGQSFSWSQLDIIIFILAWVYLFTALLWYVTPKLGWLRLLIGLPIVFMFHHNQFGDGMRPFGDLFEPVVGPIWNAPWLSLTWINDQLPGALPVSLLDLTPLWGVSLLKFAGITLVGSVIGDVIVNRSRKAAHEPDRTIAGWGVGRALLISLLMLVTMASVFVGLKDYATTFYDLGFVSLATPFAVWLVLIPLGLLLVLVQPATDLWDRHVRVLTWWGSACLVIGLLLSVLPGSWMGTEALYFEGGISKGGPSTLSWYCTSLGLGILLLAWWTIWVDARGLRWPVGLLIANGQNPMLAYVAIRNLLAPLMALPLLLPFVSPDAVAENGSLASLDGWMRDYLGTDGPWMLALWAVGQTLLLAIAVWVLTRVRLIWRS